MRTDDWFVRLTELSKFCCIFSDIFMVPYVTACAPVQMINMVHIEHLGRQTG